jgi:hypothetical protein
LVAANAPGALRAIAVTTIAITIITARPAEPERRVGIPEGPLALFLRLRQ